MKYIADDQSLSQRPFSPWPTARRMIWKDRIALEKHRDITAYQGERLIGCLRILSDGYYFGTITELLVLPEFQNRESEANF